MKMSMLMLPMLLGTTVIYAGGPITYTFTQTATGTVGSTPFTNATLTITVVGNTSGVVYAGGPSSNYNFAYSANVATVSISGVGSGTLTNAGAVEDNQAVFGGSAGLFDSGGGMQFTVEDALIGGSALATYALATTIGPLGPQATVSPWGPIPTSLGTLTVTSASNLTFQATASSTVPTLSHWGMLLLAGLLVGAAALELRRSTRRRAIASAP
jgi:hypothetical protein